MNKFLLSIIIGTALTTGVASATVLTTVPGPSCVGGSTSSCPGAIETFSGNPGTFLAGAVAQLPEIGGPLNVPSGGTLTSAVFRDPNGQLGFYYQFVLNQDSAAIQEILLGDGAFSRALPFSLNGANVGIRTDGLGTFDSASFVASSHEPATIGFRAENVPPSGFPTLDLSFIQDPLQPGEASVTFAVLSNAPYYDTEGFSGHATVTQADGRSYVFNARGSVLIPAQIPEPATWLLVGLGLMAAGLTAKIRPYRFKN